MTSHHHYRAVLLTLLLSLSAAACSSASSSMPASTPATPSASASQQLPSPPGSAELVLNGKKIKIEYSRPSMRGRKIMGALVPYDKIWRTGANAATSLTTEADLMIGGVAVPKGSYTIYTLPSAKGWKLIINKQTGQWGTDYDKSQDLARIDLEVKPLGSPVEQFTIALDKAGSGGILKLEWENTSASASLTAK